MPYSSITRVLRAVAVAALLVAGPALAIPAAATSTVTDTDTDEQEAATDYGRMLLLLDSSGSMAEPAAGGTTKIEAARQALGAVIGDLPDEAFVGLRVYGAKVFSRSQPGACTDTQLVVPPGTDNRVQLRAAVADYTPYGETPIGYSLREAAKDIGGEGTRSVVLVSDGVATCDPDPCDVARELAQQGVDLQIDVVGLSVDAKARAQLRCIAAEGNGTYYDADSADEIAESLTTASERALRPFEIDGEVVVGGSEAATATPVAAGRYADRFGSRAGDRWYRYDRELEGSTVIVSYYEMLPGALGDLDLEVVTEAGDTCSGGATPIIHPLFTGYAKVIAAGDAPGDCADESLYVHVSRVDDGDTGAPFGMSIAEEPAITNLDALPEGVKADAVDFTMPRPTSTPLDVTPGSNFADAAELESGQTYAASVVPGEVQAFRIHVGWGQKLAVRIDRPALDGGQQLGVLAFSNYVLQIMSPVRATIDDVLRGEDVGTTRRADDRPTRQVAGTVPAYWRNREVNSATYLAGDHYILYSADFDLERSIEMPYRITVEVQGEESGAPEYVDDEEPLTGPTAEPTPTGEGEVTSEPASADSGDLPVGLRVGGVVVLGFAALGCLLVAGRLVRRG